MGKLAYAESLYGRPNCVCDMEICDMDIESVRCADFIINLHMGVRRLLTQNISAEKFLAENMDILRGKVLIGDEIGAGVVPADPFERRWRDETGTLYQALAKEADIVDRVWAGLPMRLKGGSLAEG